MNDINSVFKIVMNEHGFRQSDIARLFGISPQAVNNRLKEGADTYRICDFVKILEAMNCRLVIESGNVKRYIL